ncbi:hypothetical protein BGX28_007328 [Mortierella sp. GBA30]|nr:hypothetical protein BGX28_007328 [Mortierella sp. GBA30]
MLSSATVVQEAPGIAAHLCDPGYPHSLNTHQDHHMDGALPTQSQSHSQSQSPPPPPPRPHHLTSSYPNGNGAPQSPPKHLHPSRGRNQSKSDSSTTIPQQKKRQSTLLPVEATDDVRSTSQHSGQLDTNIPSLVQTIEETSPGSDNKKLIVRLDLRRLHPGTKDGPGSQKGTTRMSVKRKSVDTSLADSMTQTTLSASSWSAAKMDQQKPPPLPPSSGEATLEESFQLHQTHDTASTSSDMEGLENTSTPKDTTIPEGGIRKEELASTASVTSSHANSSSGPTDDESHASRNDLDSVDTEVNSYAEKRRQSPFSMAPEPFSKKRTRSSHVESIHKKKVTKDNGAVRPGPVVKRRRSLKQLEDNPNVPKDIVAVAGDERAIENNNDYCEACLGLGEFICCDSCPKAFHFSCCQPPVDPLNLPDEWDCNECRAAKNPPPPSPAGVFQHLMDNVNKTNPKVFSLPLEIQSFFKGVTANSEGEYEDSLDQKPKRKRSTNQSSSTNSMSTVRGETDSTLDLEDSRGQTRLCYQCNKSALGGRMMISCDYCPLHWHLDCLTPPMASAPPNTRKWMCPNHVDHVLPRRRKRKDAVPIQVDDPVAPNDGDIEVMPETESAAARGRSLWNEDTSAVMYRVPERSIKLGFIDRCRRVRQSIAEATAPLQTQPSEVHPAAGVLQFNLLVAAANEQSSIMTKESSDQEVQQQESVQNAVLSRMTDPAERQEYMRFRAFQRYLRANGAEEAMKQWLDQQEREKERIATEGLMNL